MQGELSHQDALEQAAAPPSPPDYVTVCIPRGGLPFLRSRPGPNILSLKKRGLMLVGIDGQNIWGSPVKAKANTLEMCCTPQCPGAHGKTASHTLGLHSPSPLPASFENPTFQNITLRFLLQLPCRSAAGSLSFTQKHIMV